MSKIFSLNKAKSEKNDEFYTQYCDIEKELINYKDKFVNKVVYCNCDDYTKSNFTKYFKDNFSELKLKKLISTGLNAKYYEYDGENEVVKELGCVGDFRSDVCTSILEQSDIVVTNPPFSLFREYLAQLEKYNKQFLIIGNVNAITYKESFRLIRDGKMWLGASIHSGDREFQVPDSYPLNAAGCRVDDQGRKFIRVKGVRWFTNMDYKERHEDLILYKNYTPEEYPYYNNYHIINVDKTSEIPLDYTGIMGVPITFLDKFNPDQFEILGIAK